MGPPRPVHRPALPFAPEDSPLTPESPPAPPASGGRPPFRMELQVRAYELDFQGHVNNSVYLSWLEHARWEGLAAFDLGRDYFRRLGVAPVVARAVLDYRRPAVLGDRVEVALTGGRIAGSRFWLEHAIRRVRDGRLLVDGHLVCVCVDLASGRPVRVPPELAAILAREVEAGPRDYGFSP